MRERATHEAPYRYTPFQEMADRAQRRGRSRDAVVFEVEMPDRDGATVPRLRSGTS